MGISKTQRAKPIQLLSSKNSGSTLGDLARRCVSWCRNLVRKGKGNPLFPKWTLFLEISNWGPCHFLIGKKQTWWKSCGMHGDQNISACHLHGRRRFLELCEENYISLYCSHCSPRTTVQTFWDFLGNFFKIFLKFLAFYFRVKLSM